MPDRLYRPHWRELTRSSGSSASSGTGGRLVIEGLRVRAVGGHHPAAQRVQDRRAGAAPPRDGCPSCCPRGPPGTRRDGAGPGRSATPTTGPGFQLRDQPALVPDGGRWLPGDWDAFVLVRGRGYWRPGPAAHARRPGRPSGPEPRQVAPGVRLGPDWAGPSCGSRSTRRPAVLSGCRSDGDDLVLEVDLTPPGGAERGRATWSCGWPKGGSERRVPATRERLDARHGPAAGRGQPALSCSARRSADGTCTSPAPATSGQGCLSRDLPEYQHRADGSDPQGPAGRSSWSGPGTATPRSRVRGEVPVIDGTHGRRTGG